MMTSTAINRAVRAMRQAGAMFPNIRPLTGFTFVVRKTERIERSLVRASVYQPYPNYGA
jgi:hypothetical protein